MKYFTWFFVLGISGVFLAIFCHSNLALISKSAMKFTFAFSCALLLLSALMAAIFFEKEEKK